MNADEREDTTIYKVVVNHEEQYSIWAADRFAIEVAPALLPGRESRVREPGYAPSEPLRCPITVLGGTRDEEAPPNELDLWREETTGDFNVKMLDGDHFFINQPPQQNDIIRIITTTLQLPRSL